MPVPLHWGEVIPLAFIPEAARARARFLILSQPSRRVKEAVAMIPEELELGAGLASRLEALREKVVVVVSADGAHTHSHVSGPAPPACVTAPPHALTGARCRTGPTGTTAMQSCTTG